MVTNSIDNGALILGIDVGTSGMRACLVNPHGDIKSFSAPRMVLSAGVPMDLPERDAATGRSEQACTVWSRALEALFAALAQQPEWPALAHRISHIVADATSSTVVLCDQQSAIPLGKALMYDDRRAVEQAELIAEATALQREHNTGAQGANSTLAKVLWVLQNIADNNQPVNGSVQICHQIDWINRLLSGKWCATDENNALKLGYDARQRSWPDWVKTLLADYAARSRCHITLPEVVAPGSPLAPVAPVWSERWGINPAALVCAGTTDSIAGFLASGAAECGDAVSSLGSTLAFKQISKTPIFAPQYGVYSHRLGDWWLVGGASNSGGAVLMHYFDLPELQNTLQALEADADGLSLTPTERFYPLLHAGERFPIADPAWPPRMPSVPAKNASLAEKKAFLLALLHGLSHIERLGYERLRALGADPLKRLYTVGGGSQNAIWQRLRQTYLDAEFATAQSRDAAYGVTRLVSEFSSQNKESKDCR
ncbi:FGGY family carbohydrate kinase [Thiomicrorhabdus cannonii]|uniref:FGGY family carbohydrate kinase n=1 Tax=Thiomicrorhabdus cannonii TaxID=2748011 RepID=UPI0015BB9D13